jgi:hypothetical protein
MKVWLGYGSEHSANLVIIGKFEATNKAREALDLLNEARDIAQADEAAGHIKAGAVAKHFSDGIMDLFKRTNLFFGYGDPEELLSDFSAKQDGDKIVITTNELEVNAFLKILINRSAKVEIYSAHDHGGPYGRQTRTAT